LLTNVVVLFMV